MDYGVNYFTFIMPNYKQIYKKGATHLVDASHLFFFRGFRDHSCFSCSNAFPPGLDTGDKVRRFNSTNSTPLILFPYPLSPSSQNINALIISMLSRGGRSFSGGRRLSGVSTMFWMSTALGSPVSM